MIEGAAAVVRAAPSAVAGEGAVPPVELVAGVTSLRFSARAMASPLRLTVVAPWEPTSLRAATRAWAEVRDEFEASEQAMSRFRESSAITRLNRAVGLGLGLSVDGRLRRALVAARRAQRLTGGRFDPRVLRDLERLGYRGAAVGQPELRHLPEVPRDDDRPWLSLRRSGPCASLDAPIDLGGIGKGLALRWARARVRHVLVSAVEGGPVPEPAHGSFLLEAGGDLVADGSLPEGGPWLVGIEDPRGGRGPVAVVGLSNGGLATSSVALNRWMALDGRQVHHLLDPRTGQPGGDGLLAVTVAGRDPAWSEVWSKALFLAGARAIGDEARGRGVAAWWVTTDGALRMTPAARARTIWAA